jgi:ABC-type antimicrobial peptide transport system permease subunit
MLRNFFKIAIRNINRNKGFSILNIGGLAIGMASALLVLLWVQNELSFDSEYRNNDRLYQAWNRNMGNDGLNCWNNTMKILGPTLKKDFPEVEGTSRVNWDATILFTRGEKKLNVIGTMVDPDFLTMFEFPFIRGNRKTALNNPNDIVITEKLSRQIFGNEDAMGKILRLDNKYDFRVSAVMKDLPNNTEFDFQYLLPWSYMHTVQQDDSVWDKNSTHNFVLLKPHTDLKAFNAKLQHILKKYGNPEWTTEMFLYPVSRLHLYSNFVNGVPSGGKIEMVRIFIVIAVLILLIACINFINMSTARSEQRAKEVGIRKVSGAMQNSLIIQFIAESIFIAGIAGIIALLIVQLSLPAFNTLTKKQLFIDYGSLYFWLSFAAFILFTGLLSGIYPAFFLSSFKPVAVLKGSFKKAESLVTPRKVLVIVQFSFAIMLIVSTLVIERQIKYAQDRNNGYDKNQLVYIFMFGDIEKNYQMIREELMNKQVALSVTKTSAPLTESWSSGGADWSGKSPNDKTGFDYYNTDGGIVKTAGLTLLQGRDIDLVHYPADSMSTLLNESAVKVMGFKNPVGQVINQEWRVVGVVKNFILQSPYDPVKPMIINGPGGHWFNMIHIRLNGNNSTGTNIGGIEKIFKKYNPVYPFEYRFTDEDYAKKFNDDQTTGTLSLLFSGLTIFISCLGLFGLAAFMAEKRIKEIGVRKVLGASVASITGLLSADFVKLVIISIFIASPIAWLVMNKWLMGYDYHISIPFWIFISAGGMALLIAILTVSFQSIKAARANPVISLRSE